MPVELSHVVVAVLAAEEGFVLESYRDQATGVIAMNSGGKMVITEVTRHPRMTFEGKKRPTRDLHPLLHHNAYEQCFITNPSKQTSVAEPMEKAANE